MRSLRIVTLALVFLSCGPGKVDLTPAASWASTLSYMSKLWIENRVPTSLLHHSVDSARKEIEKTRKQLDHPQLAAFDAAATALDQAVTDGDKGAAARAGQRCDAIARALEDLQRSVE